MLYSFRTFICLLLLDMTQRFFSPIGFPHNFPAQILPGNYFFYTNQWQDFCLTLLPIYITVSHDRQNCTLCDAPFPCNLFLKMLHLLISHCRFLRHLLLSVHPYNQLRHSLCQPWTYNHGCVLNNPDTNTSGHLQL